MKITDYIKSKFEEKVNKKAGEIGKLPDFKRVKLELYLYAYLVIAFFVLIFLQGFFYNTFRTILFSVAMVSFLLQFISHCNLYNKLKFLNQFKYNPKK